ncbi:MAG: SUMF1/EgtB/PvdO family nonheme iron enzyme [Anaerolineae bacterium]|nr:SUMF1/EgtB/PvdO family nonheme iron enzyme [Anaerolineae bacterium]
MSTDENPNAANVFFSYAHEDEALRDKLEEHLSILKRRGIISTWHDRKIGAGREWAGAISEAMEAAQVILLLISPAFINSDYCYDIEMRRAIQRHEQGTATVIPIILRPVFWQDAPFGKLQALPKDAKPVTKWGNRDEAFETITSGIEKAVAAAAPGLPATPPDTTTHAINIDSVLEKMVFVSIPTGVFQMGSDDGNENEKPAHRVEISQPFDMGAYVVTQSEWRGVMGTEPWSGQNNVRYGDLYPAVYVSWGDAQTFIAKLNAFDDKHYYRLPTEAEWEYAARAGTTTKFSFGDDEQKLNGYGWYIENAYNAGLESPQEVGKRQPNPWGLHDMHGNVWEWVEDWYYGSYTVEESANKNEKVVRGGGYDFSADGARSAFRNHVSPIRPNHVIGFRVVRESI